jgi:putative protein-disulfide isomerase
MAPADLGAPVTAGVLHYIHDPLCGWCYGAAPLVRSAREVIPVVAHGGGMMAGGRRQVVNEQLRGYVMQHDRRIANLTGQSFGEAYFNGLLRDPTAVFDSEPPTTAMLAADDLEGAGLDLLVRMQKAHYVEGRKIAQESVLTELAVEIGLPAKGFGEAFRAKRGAPTQEHFSQSIALLHRLGGNGFPTFALEKHGELEMLDVGGYVGHPAEWKSYLQAKTT